MAILKNPIVQSALVVVGVIAVLKLFKTQISALPVVGTYLTLN